MENIEQTSTSEVEDNRILDKLDYIASCRRGVKAIAEGQGIYKTMVELEAMEE